ncbi:inhibitor of KinA [Chitinophaga sp. CF118]|uniref:5-oxoprolinase subunit PxpB n=1 Tax=Chitinophaga sp. CF118 TaxID=1884367 RepID=UPI0008E6B69D|nr:5-oxoprolinase subunit PxpB [Chitinophaga sp. CF118]SFD23635.1 inhibitor of KinA [Chitinophaga sp. CF118]
MNSDYNIAPLGDHSIIIEWEQQMDPVIHQRVMSVFYHLQSLQLPYIRDLIPAYASLTIVYQPSLTPRLKQQTASQEIQVMLKKMLEQITTSATAPPRILRIPVCYDPSLALDIQSMAEQKGLSVDRIIELHTQQPYTVYMLGFLPGFPYMGKVDDQLATPRLKKPRLKVPAGSVGIAGSQTGIYSMTSPGGWNIIGQTPIRMFDPHKASPCFCNPGDQVQFTPVSLEAFHKMI